MNEFFLDPERRLARAKEQIGNLRSESDLFFGESPYAKVIETEPETGNQIHKIKLTKALPNRLLDIAVEIVEGLRATLDKCGYAAAMATGNTRLKATYFPIADTDAQLDTDVIGRGRCKDLPPEILAVFRSFQPYKAGNPLLWGVNQLANGSKHRILVPVAVSTGPPISGKVSSPDTMILEMRMPPIWDRKNDEMIILVAEPGPEPKYRLNLSVFIEIGPNSFSGQPALTVFDAMAAEVERVLVATKAETLRILSS